ncbi:thiazolinyl imide reductase [Streptomyces sp. HPH0547]|uniref:Thiazolinyl imide reductase n=1 Tax=Streptomyces albus TaxID=1888 RepID=A0A8H1LAD6_9ACTN|nr:thiazolinyl imide reductase [Streptomyces sp. HPH0547]TGG79732.1 thiazolinyl imide reductase [Streptomyces albus]
MNRPRRPLRVVVAGTAFGRIYLDAVRRDPDAFTLTGILAKGGDYSRRSAERAGVPLHTDAAHLPDDTDILCVVVRSGATGGPGSDIARTALRRGIHVLQEHPVHAGELAGNLRAARDGDAAYAVGTLYPDLAPVRAFLAAAEVLRARGPVRFVDAACNSQVAYPLLDVLGRAAGALRPWAFRAQPGPDARLTALTGHQQPFRTAHAVIGGTPVTLRVQNEVHPDDPDNHSHLLHRLALGTDAGVLTLADTHGPVLWNPRLHAPRDTTGRLVLAGPGTERLAAPSTVELHPAAGSYHHVFAQLWPQAVLAALHRLRDAVTDRALRPAAGQWALSVSRCWADLTAQLGMPELIRPGEPPVVDWTDLRDAAAAASTALARAGEQAP